MATNHTTNYNLNLWEPTDKFVREEFNENTNKIDAAIKAVDTKADTKAAASTVTALTQTVNQKARIAVGHYEGDGAETRFISVGFTPRAVLLMTQNGYTYLIGGSYNSAYGGLAVTGSSGGRGAVEIVSGGFKVASNGTYLYSNHTDYKYNYIAFG